MKADGTERSSTRATAIWLVAVGASLLLWLSHPIWSATLTALFAAIPNSDDGGPGTFWGFVKDYLSPLAGLAAFGAAAWAGLMVWRQVRGLGQQIEVADRHFALARYDLILRQLGNDEARLRLVQAAADECIRGDFQNDQTALSWQHARLRFQAAACLRLVKGLDEIDQNTRVDAQFRSKYDRSKALVRAFGIRNESAGRPRAQIDRNGKASEMVLESKKVDAYATLKIIDELAYELQFAILRDNDRLLECERQIAGLK